MQSVAFYIFLFFKKSNEAIINQLQYNKGFNLYFDSLSNIFSIDFRTLSLKKSFSMILLILINY